MRMCAGGSSLSGRFDCPACARREQRVGVDLQHVERAVAAEREVHCVREAGGVRRERAAAGIDPVGPSTDGGIWAVPRGGGTPEKIELPAGTLTEPGGIAIGKDGDLYVSNHSREAGAGEVLKIDLGGKHHHRH
jgi:hypothetical protein